MARSTQKHLHDEWPWLVTTGSVVWARYWPRLEASSGWAVIVTRSGRELLAGAGAAGGGVTALAGVPGGPHPGIMQT